VTLFNKKISSDDKMNKVAGNVRTYITTTGAPPVVYVEDDW
jgi:hypothetical protein